MSPLDRIADRLQGFAAFQDRPGATAELEAIAAEIRAHASNTTTERDPPCQAVEGATGVRCDQTDGHPLPHTGTWGEPGDEYSGAITWPRPAAATQQAEEPT